MLNTEQLAGFEAQDLLLFPSIFSAAEVAVLRASADNTMKRSEPEMLCEPGLEMVRLVYGVHRFEEAFFCLDRHPYLIDAVDDNPPTKFDCEEHHCTGDWSQIEPLEPDGLLAMPA